MFKLLIIYKRSYHLRSLRTLGPKIWNSLHEDVKNLTSLPNLQNSLKHGTDLNENATSANTQVTRITVLELPTLAWTCPSGNRIPNIGKRNTKRNEPVVFWCVYSWFLVCTHPLGFISIHFFGLGFDPISNGFHCTKSDFSNI